MIQFAKWENLRPKENVEEEEEDVDTIVRFMVIIFNHMSLKKG